MLFQITEEIPWRIGAVYSNPSIQSIILCIIFSITRWSCDDIDGWGDNKPFKLCQSGKPPATFPNRIMHTEPTIQGQSYINSNSFWKVCGQNILSTSFENKKTDCTCRVWTSVLINILICQFLGFNKNTILFLRVNFNTESDIWYAMEIQMIVMNGMMRL